MPWPGLSDSNMPACFPRRYSLSLILAYRLRGSFNALGRHCLSPRRFPRIRRFPLTTPHFHRLSALLSVVLPTLSSAHAAHPGDTENSPRLAGLVRLGTLFLCGSSLLY